jgi:uncharacterized repeat protein (TIGR01451 family)
MLVPASASADVYSVSNTNDVPAQNAASGSCATPLLSSAAGACTLRSAVQAANQVAGPSTINVAAGTYVLTIAPSGADDDSTGDLNVTNLSGKITINGAGSGTSGTIVDGNFTDQIFSLNTDTDVEIVGVRIRNGRTGGLGQVTTCPAGGGGVDDLGGGIYTDGALTLTNDVITGNMSSGHGGGLARSGNDPLTIKSTTFDGNISCQGDSSFHAGGGAAIFGFGTAAVTIDRSTFSNNSADANGNGGGAAIFVTATITNSTFSGNDADHGGGIDHEGEGPQLDLFADTFTSNTARGGGSALYVSGGVDSVVNTTISGNIGDGAIASGFGNTTISFSTLTNNQGNIVDRDGADFNLNNSIVTGSPGANCNGSISSGHNVFDDSGSECGAISNDVKSADPKLGPLQDNGGPTQTRALLTGSPAIDAGEIETCTATAKNVDQRAVTRPKGPECDVGAFEYVAADLALTASASPSTIQVGEQSTVTDVITNNGPVAATSVKFTDPAAGFTINSATPSQGTCTHTDTTVTCNLGTIAVGGKVQIEIVLTANSPGEITLNSSVDGAELDPNTNNNDATATITVEAPAEPPKGCVDKRSFVFRFPADREDRGAGDTADLDEGRVVTVKIYDNGRLVSTRHGRNIRKLTIKRRPRKGVHVIRIVGFLDNGFRIVLTRSYYGCKNGPTSVRILRPRKLRDDRP